MIIPRRWGAAAFQVVSVPGIVMMAGAPGFAAVYLTLEQAQQAIFPGQGFTSVVLALSDEERKAIEKKWGAPAQFAKQRIWRASEGGYFIVDEVIGKHEFITYAVGINPDGSVCQVEIMDYRESYGNEIRQKKWRRQFIGKTNTSPLQLGKDIKNISGATLSCRHVTDGVRRIVSLYEIALKK